MVPTTGEQEIDTALEVLQTAREAEKEAEAEKNEDRGEIGNGDWDEDMVDEVGQPLALVGTVDNALKILVRNATEEFGFAPRDVYDGVFQLYETRDKHSAAVGEFDHTKLQETVRSFSQDHGLTTETSHRVVVVFPHPLTSLFNLDRWGIDFKSIRIAREAMESMQLQEVERLREMYQLFHRIPESSILAGWVFEAIVHRLFTDGWQSGPILQPIRMDCKGSPGSPVFLTDPPHSTSHSTLNTPSPLRANTRAVTQVNLASRELSDVTLDNDKYYILAAANHPLFNSFTIDLILPTGENSATGVISVFQTTTSLRHEGSAAGYPHIHKIMSHVRYLLRGRYPNPTVKVVYFLVCPDGESQHRWQMPAGWDERTTRNDHRGECFCIRIPVPGLHGALHPFTPNFSTELNCGRI